MSKRSAVPLALAMAGLLLCGCRDQGADERAIAQAERDWGQTFVTGDTKVADRLTADDFSGVSPDGSSYDKAAMLKSLREGPRLVSDEVSGLTIRFFGDTALAQGLERETGPAPDRRSVEHVFTDVWIRREGAWKVVAATDLERKQP